MIGITKLYCGAVQPSDPLRYGRKAGALPSHLLQFSVDKKPVVVWNCTKACNLRCLHCYAGSGDPGLQPDPELSGDEARRMIDDLGQYGVPVLLFSGGEPMARTDLPELVSHAKKAGLRAVLSTNGTLLTRALAERFASIGLSYMGISLDGLEKTHDHFRGREGAFKEALRGIRLCKEFGIKVGVRLTLHRQNLADLPGLFSLLEEEQIPRVCFYHLVAAGRGKNLEQDRPTHTETRRAVDLILEKARDFERRKITLEVLTVDNHTDGVYLLQRLLREDPARAAEVRKLLEMNGGNNSGSGIASIGWDGQIYPDQFMRNHPVGNVLEKPFSETWASADHPLLKQLRNRAPLLKGRCATCEWQPLCNGNFRARAEALTGDLWAADPACYLTEEELNDPEKHKNTGGMPVPPHHSRINP